MATQELQSTGRRRRTSHRWFRLFATGMFFYLVLAYLVVPSIWLLIETFNPSDHAKITTTRDGHPGDPINVSLIGNRSELESIMKSAGWFQADKLGIRSDVAIAVDTIVDRQYEDAPVSRLFLFGRAEDLAFELPVPSQPRHRHHVRFWKSMQTDESGREIWLGSASFDDRVGFSHTTGEITHHIAPNVDSERDFIAASLRRTNRLASEKIQQGFHDIRRGFNGGGDLWETDGAIWQAIIQPE